MHLLSATARTPPAACSPVLLQVDTGPRPGQGSITCGVYITLDYFYNHICHFFLLVPTPKRSLKQSPVCLASSNAMVMSWKWCMVICFILNPACIWLSSWLFSAALYSMRYVCAPHGYTANVYSRSQFLHLACRLTSAHVAVVFMRTTPGCGHTRRGAPASRFESCQWHLASR